MRICYLLPGIGMSDAEKARRQAVLNDIAAAGTEVVVDAIKDGPTSIENAVDEYSAMPHVLAYIIDNNDAFDAFITGCAGDTALEGAREQSRKPVIGPGESSILLGTLGDRRFSMVTISDERARIKRRMVRDAGLGADRMVSSHSLGIPVLDLYKDKAATVDRLVEIMGEARAAGAETMLIGCMSVAFLEPHHLADASRRGGLPLINPIVTAVKLAEALVTVHGYGKTDAATEAVLEPA